MALTTEFPGSTLPDGWAALEPAGSAVTVADGWLQLTAPSGTSYDTIHANSGVNGAICAYHAVPDHGGPISWAVQLSTDIGDTKSWGYALLACDVGGEDNSGGGWARYSVFRPNTNDERPNRFAASRPAGSGTGSGGANAYNTHVNNAPLGLQSGTPGYLRLDFDGIDAWQPYVSTDGVTWVADTPFTRAITPTRLLLGFTSTNPTTAGTVRIAGSWDLLDLGTTDLRAALPERGRAVVSSFAGDVVALPAGWADDSVTDTVTFTGTAVRLSSDAANVGSRARIRWTGTRYQSCGLLVRAAFPSFDSDLFTTCGLTTDEGAGDPYVRDGGGYGMERGNTAVRPIRLDNPVGSNVASSPGATGLDEKRYAWLRDTTGVNLASTTPTLMFRFERPYIDDGGLARWRCKSWADAGSLAASLAAEPATWDIFDGQDDIERSLIGPTIALAHNNPAGGLVGTGQMDLLYVEFYQLLAAVEPATRTSTAQPLGALKSLPLPTADRSAAAQPLGATKALGLDPATRTATAEALAATKASALPTATRTAAALDLAGQKSRTLAAAVRTSTAQPMSSGEAPPQVAAEVVDIGGPEAYRQRSGVAMPLVPPTYAPGDALPALGLRWVDADGPIALGSGWTFEARVGQPGQPALVVKATGITGATLAADADADAENLTIAWAAGELDDVPPGEHSVTVIATQTSGGLPMTAQTAIRIAKVVAAPA